MELIHKVEKINWKMRLKKKQLGDMVGVSETTFFKILRDHFGITKCKMSAEHALVPLKTEMLVECFRTFLDL